MDIFSSRDRRAPSFREPQMSSECPRSPTFQPARRRRHARCGAPCPLVRHEQCSRAKAGRARGGRPCAGRRALLLVYRELVGLPHPGHELVVDVDQVRHQDVMRPSARMGLRRDGDARRVQAVPKPEGDHETGIRPTLLAVDGKRCTGEVVPVRKRDLRFLDANTTVT